MGKIKEIAKQNIYLYKSVRALKIACRYFFFSVIYTLLFYISFFLRKIGILHKDSFAKTLKDKHKNENIFVIATGPSLSIETLDKLKESNAITIGMNGIFKLFSKTNWRPTYYVLDDYYLPAKYLHEHHDLRFDEIATNGTVMSEQCRKHIPYASNMTNTAFIPYCYFDHWETHYSNFYDYNKDITCGCFDFYTIANFAITLADYLGAKNVFLLGVDCDYTSSMFHTYDKQRNKLTPEEMKANKDTEYGMLKGYQKLSELIGNDIKIYNLNPGGKVNSFPRITLDEALRM